MKIIGGAGFGSSPQPPFQESPREFGSAESECNCGGQHDSSPGNPESDDNNMLGNAELLQRHGPREDLYAPAGTDGNESGGRPNSA